MALSYQGLKALGVPDTTLASFPQSPFSRAWRRGADSLGDTGESAPEHWEPPLGGPDVHLAIYALAPGASRLDDVLAGAREALRDVPGVTPIWQLDTYSCENGRTSLGFKDGISHPAIEGSGIPGTNPHDAPFKAGEFVLGYPNENGELPADAAAERARSEWQLHRLPQAAARGWRTFAGTSMSVLLAPPRRSGSPRNSSAAGQAERRWRCLRITTIRSSGPIPRGTTPSCTQEDDARGAEVPARRARPQGVPARRPHHRRRAHASDHPTRLELRPDAARGRSGRRRRRSRHSVRLHPGKPRARSSSSSRPSGSTTAPSSARPMSATR